MSNDRAGLGESLEIQVINGTTGKTRAHIYKVGSVSIDIEEVWSRFTNGVNIK